MKVKAENMLFASDKKCTKLEHSTDNDTFAASEKCSMKYLKI